MKKIIESKNAPAPIGPYSQAIQANGLLFVSGQIAMDPATGEMINKDIVQETQQVMKNLQAILTEAGLTFDHVLKSTIFVKDLNNFGTVNQVYGEYFKANPPARETVEVARLPKDAGVEISVIAAL
jgi:2-iminobutanoate/2-iminopropanoate deaminase